MDRIMEMISGMWGNGKTVTNGSTLVVALVMVLAKRRGIEISEAEILAGMAAIWTVVGVIAKFTR